MNRTTKAMFAALSLMTVAGAAALIAAGPLNPPSGAVTSTGKTLSEIEPRTAINATNTPGTAQSMFRISQPGSYYLTSNLSVTAGKYGILIESANVTVDLGGFVIAGQTGSSSGVRIASSWRNVVVKNGIITNMGGGGVDTPAPFISLDAAQTRIENIIVSGCAGDGIYILDGTVRNCQLSTNAGSGIRTSNLGGATPHESLVDNCSADNNGVDGISISRGVIQNSAATGNNGIGIASDTGTISHCTANQNDTGFRVAAVVLSECVARTNGVVGIQLDGGGVVRNSLVTADTLIATRIGIQTTASNGVRLEGNQIKNMGTAINCTTANNLVIGNSFRNCTTAVNAIAGNRVGTIVVGTSSPAINGNSGGGLGVTDSFANIIH